MASLNMKGPYDLNESSVSNNVTSKKVGNYALGKMGTGTEASTFMVSYVGRSDGDLADRLREHIGEYSRFKFSYADSVESAFREECRNYHDFGPAGNKVHPASPAGSSVKCPSCS